MWKKYLRKKIKRNTFEESLDKYVQNHIEKQFEHLSCSERWNTMSLIENKKLIRIHKRSKEKTVEHIVHDFEDTIYQCEQCGSKKIDIKQLQTRGAVSVLYISIFSESSHAVFFCFNTG